MNFIRKSLNWFFWDRRNTPLPWLVMLSGSALIAWLFPLFLQFAYGLSDFEPDFKGVWPFLTAVSAAPIAWYVFYIRDKNKQTDQKHERERNTTERFAKAIDHLGALDEKGNPVLEIRMGGIYSLEKTARESEDGHWPIMEVLTAYVRKNAPYSVRKDRRPGARPEPDEKNGIENRLPGDILAIVNILRRREWRGREETLWEGLDLSRTNLAQANLFEAHLKGTNLEHANLTGANLEGTNLKGANLEWANLEGANLKGANLEGASLMAAHLERANLKGAHLEEAHLEAANLKEVNLIGANLEGATLQSANLKGADLAGASLALARLEQANLQGANLERANLKGAHLVGTPLVGAVLAGANLAGAHLEAAFLEGANLKGANLEGASLMAAHLERANLAGANLAATNLEAYLEGADLEGANLMNAKVDRKWEALWKKEDGNLPFEGQPRWVDVEK